MGERLRILHVRYADTSLAESRENKSTQLKGCFCFSMLRRQDSNLRYRANATGEASLEFVSNLNSAMY
jgi:hypothetical protein